MTPFQHFVLSFFPFDNNLFHSFIHSLLKLSSWWNGLRLRRQACTTVFHPLLCVLLLVTFLDLGWVLFHSLFRPFDLISPCICTYTSFRLPPITLHHHISCLIRCNRNYIVLLLDLSSSFLSSNHNQSLCIIGMNCPCSCLLL